MIKSKPNKNRVFATKSDILDDKSNCTATDLMPRILACPLSATCTVPSGATATAEREPKASCVERTLPLSPQPPAPASLSPAVQLKKPAQLQGSEKKKCANLKVTPNQSSGRSHKK